MSSARLFYKVSTWDHPNTCNWVCFPYSVNCWSGLMKGVPQNGSDQNRLQLVKYLWLHVQGTWEGFLSSVFLKQRCQLSGHLNYLLLCFVYFYNVLRIQASLFSHCQCCIVSLVCACVSCSLNTTLFTSHCQWLLWEWTAVSCKNSKLCIYNVLLVQLLDESYQNNNTQALLGAPG